VTDAGKARSALNGMRHGLFAAELQPADEAGRTSLAELRQAYERRFRPMDAAEQHWCEELARVAWRQQRLFALECAVLDRFDAAARGEDLADLPPLPSLDTITRYRARLDRDYRNALRELELLLASRPRPLPPSGKDEPERTLPGTPDPPAATPAPAFPTAALPPPPAPPLNRHLRRALAALERKGGGKLRAA
jgi:hypothetical protein